MAIVALAFASSLFGLARCVGDAPTSTPDGGSPGDATIDAVTTDSGGADTSVGSDGCSVTCKGQCTNMTTDEANCGACGNACAQGLACIAGHCGGVVSIASSGNAACALRTDGSVWCWGETTDGETGAAPKLGSEPVPTRAGSTTLTKVVELVGGDGFFCARQSDESVWCWGINVNDQLGHPAASDGTCADPRYNQPIACNATPQSVNLPQGVVPTALVAGGDNVCFTAASADGGAGSDVYCWGQGTYLFAGVATPTPVRIIALDGRVSSLSLGGLFACVLTTNGQTLCWGDNVYGQLGHAPGTAGDNNPVYGLYYNETPTSPLDANAQPIAGIAALQLGLTAACGRKADDTVWCWGMGYYGELGTGASNATYAAHLPAHVPGIAAAALLATGHGSYGQGTMLVRAKDETTWSWGDNELGQLATGNLYTGSTCGGGNVPCAPSPVVSSSSLDTAAQIAMVGPTGLALMPDGRIEAWGSNATSLLGHAPGQQGDLACASPFGPDGGTPCSPTPSALPPLP